eukprot:scaffold286_cov169-Amphora_coffeaeformis.AAC.19
MPRGNRSPKRHDEYVTITRTYPSCVSYTFDLVETHLKKTYDETARPLQHGKVDGIEHDLGVKLNGLGGCDDGEFSRLLNGRAGAHP